MSESAKYIDFHQSWPSLDTTGAGVGYTFKTSIYLTIVARRGLTQRRRARRNPVAPAARSYRYNPYDRSQASAAQGPGFRAQAAGA